jgi:hypothetical protein
MLYAHLCLSTLPYAQICKSHLYKLTVQGLLTMEDWLMTCTTAIGGVQCVIEVNDLYTF